MSQRAIYKRTTGSPKQLPVFNSQGPQAKPLSVTGFITLPNGVKSEPVYGDSGYHLLNGSQHGSLPVRGNYNPRSELYLVNGGQPNVEYQKRSLKPKEVYNTTARERQKVNIVFDSNDQLASSVGRYQKRSKSTPPLVTRDRGERVVDYTSVNSAATASISKRSVPQQQHYTHRQTGDNVIYANVNGSISSRSRLDQSSTPPPIYVSPVTRHAWDVNDSPNPGIVNTLDYSSYRASSPSSVFSDRVEYVRGRGPIVDGDTVIYRPSSEVIMMGNYYDPQDIYRDTRGTRSLSQSKAKFSSMPILFMDKDSEKKFLKKEKKREKEERKRIEKEEKKRRKAEKKAATLNAKTMPKNWGFDTISRSIEATYARPRLRMRAVPIEFDDGPSVPPPPRPWMVHSSGLQKKLFYTSVPNLQQAIYANTPSIQRVEQVYGTSSRYSLNHYLPQSPVHREYAPKTVLLHRSPEGYGFVLRGARSQSASASLEFQPCPEFPALQYLDSVDPGSQSDRAGLKTGDFILEINGENVVRATHERVVQLIRTSKDALVMKVITARPVEKSSDWFTHQDGSMTLPNRKKQAPLPPKRNPDTSLSYSKATSKSMAEGLAEIEKLDQTLAEFDKTGNRRHSLSTNELPGEQKTASVRGSHAMKRVSCVDINHIVVGDHIEPAEPTYDTPSVQRPKEYMSPAEQRIKKYHKKHNGTMERSKSTPDLAGPDEVVYASTSIPGSGVAVYNRSPVNRSHVTYQKPGSPSHYGQGHVAEVKRPMSQIDSDRLKSAVYAGPVVVRRNVEDTDPPVVPGRAPVPKRQAPNPPNKSEVVSISTSRNDNMYANVSAEIQARKQTDKEESPYESSFRPGTLARLTNQPRVTTASLEQAKLKSHRKTNSMGAINVQAEEEKNTDEKVMQNAAAFIQKHPNAKLLVTADVHQKKYYEPEPDYDNESDDERSLRSASSLRAQGAISRQSSVTSGGSRSTEDAKMLALEAQKSVRPKSTSVTVISVGDTTVKRSSPVTERHYAVHSDIPSVKKAVNSDPTDYGESKITIKSTQPSEQSSIVTQSNVTTIQTGHYSSQTMRPSSSTPASSVNNSRRSSIQSNQSAGKDMSSENDNITQIPVAPPPPKHTTPPPPKHTTPPSPKHSVNLSSQYSAPPSPKHVTPPPQAPPPPPPPPAPPAPPPIPTTLPPSYSQETLNKTPPKPESTNQPLVSASDIMNAVKLRQNRIENDSPRMSQTKPSQVPPVKSSIDLNQEALKAAVAARKSRLLKSDETAVVDQIESRLQKTKKLQSAKYFFSSDTIKTESTVKEDDKSQATLPRPISKKAPAPDPPVISKPKSPQVAGKSKQIASPPVKGEAPKSPASKPDDSTQSNDFLARAEKARQEILQKKSGGSKNQSVTPIYSSGGSKSNKKIDSKPTPADQSNDDEQMSIKDKIASFEKQKKSNGGVTNGNNIELDGVTEDHSHTEAGNTLTRNGSSAYASTVVAPPPGFTDTLDIIPPPVNFSNDASVDSGHGSDHYHSAFGHDDSASLVSSASTLSTLSSEHGEHTANRMTHYEDILPPPPPAFCDNINDFEDIPGDVIPPPPQFSNSNDNKPKPLRPYQTKSVDSWLCTDVLDWLDSLNMAQYKSSFAKNCIDGPKLLTLGRNDYIELGVTQVGHRMNLERSIKKVALGKISTAM